MADANYLLKLAARLLRYSFYSTIALVFALSCLYWYLPDSENLILENPRTTAYIDIKCTSDCPLEWTPLTQISFFAQRAVILAEDAGFYYHNGISLSSLKRALRINMAEGRIVWGGSTISMQLARNLYLYPEKTIFRKLQEVLLALKLERTLSKKRLLEIYLNVVEWRPDVFGITKASRHLFQRMPNELGPLESSLLASILPSPRLAANPDTREKFREKGARIFDHLVSEQLPRELQRNSDCAEQINPQDILAVDDILETLFVQNGIDIVTGDAALLSLNKISAQLNPRQNAFITRLGTKMANGRPPLTCLMPESVDKTRMNAIDSSKEGFRIWVPDTLTPKLNTLIKRASNDGIVLRIESAYRSAGYQTYIILKELRRRSYCLSDVMSFIEAPGLSEHGCLDSLAVDFSSKEQDLNDMPFIESKAFQWLVKHGQSFNLGLSYPEDVIGPIRSEPWHWRFEPVSE